MGEGKRLEQKIPKPLDFGIINLPLMLWRSFSNTISLQYNDRTEKKMIYLLKLPVTSIQIQEMLVQYEDMIKIVVDIRRRMVSGGGEMHADCESVLLDDGSEQDDLWGANWYPAEQRIEFESLINIRPRLGNRSILIQDENLRKQVETITREILGGVK
jgi:uncharacterized protein DUF5674